MLWRIVGPKKGLFKYGGSFMPKSKREFVHKQDEPRKEISLSRGKKKLKKSIKQLVHWLSKPLLWAPVSFCFDS